MKPNKNNNPPSSREIDRCLNALAEGDDTALERLYNLVGTSVYAYALSVLRNKYDAEDVMHDCIVKIYEQAASYTSHGKPMAWILTIAKNMCYARFNLNKRFADVTDEELEQQFAGNERMNADDKLLVQGCLAKLSATERQIVVMHAVGGIKHREIADMLGLSLSTTLSKYNRALAKLQQLIKE